MPRFAFVFLLSLFLSAILLACAAEPTPTPTPPPWIEAAEGYSALAEEMVKDVLADVDFAFAALDDTTKPNHVRIREAESRVEIAVSRQKEYEVELNDARRDIKAPAAVEERASALSNAVSQVHFDALDNLERAIGWAGLLVDIEGNEADPQGFGEKAKASDDLSASMERFDAALADFKAAVEQGKSGSR